MKFSGSLSLLLILLCLSSVIIAQNQAGCYPEDHANGARARERNVDFEHLKLKISFNTLEKEVIGVVEHKFQALQKRVDTLFLDGPDIEILSAKLDDKKIEFKSNKDGHIFKFDPPLKWEKVYHLKLQYKAHPKKGLYFVGWDQEKSRKQIWTQGQGIDNRHWIPMYDNQNDKITTNIEIVFPSKYKVLSNGVLEKKKINRDGTTSWNYVMNNPHSPYLIMLGIGDYGIDERKSARGIPLNLWYYPDQADKVEPTYRYSVDQMDWMEKETGLAYPWKEYSQIPVQDFMYGAMENTTATIFGDFFYVNEREYLDYNYVAVNAHELAHQWFGDYVSARSPKHHWLQESFATQYQKHCVRENLGEDYFEWNRRRELNKALDASKKDMNPIVHSKAGSARIYQKGSLVLDMLRYVLGNDAYRKSIKWYLDSHPFGFVDTDDLYEAFWETLGVNLDWFFDQWLYRPGEPHYKVSYKDIQSTDKQRETQITVNQIHNTDDYVGYFKMPIIFEVHYQDGSFDREKKWISKQYHEVIISNTESKKIDYVLFDPGQQIIRQLSFKKGYQELVSQAAKAKSLLDRYDALLALRSHSTEKKLDDLISLYKKEKSYINRAEITAQLLSKQELLDDNQIKVFLQDKHHKVRYSAVNKLNPISQTLKPELIKLLSDSSYWNVELTLDKLCSHFPEDCPQFLEITKDDFGVGNKMKIKWLEIACKLSKEKYLPELINYSGPQHEYLTRKNAFAALQRINYLDQELLSNLFNASVHFNRRFRTSTHKVIKYFLQQNEYKELIHNYYLKNTWSEWEKSILSRQIK